MTLEHKIDICLRYIAEQGTDGEQLAREAREALRGTQIYNRTAAIEDILKEMGVNGANLGWGYLRTGIGLCMEDEQRLHSITGYLYPAIAEAHGTTAARVERSIRHSLDGAFLVGDLDAQYKVFGNTTAMRGKPTNSGFIAGCVHELRRREGM